MTNNYVSFISDEHLLYCIKNLHNAYVKAKNNITKKSFYANKVDSIKLTFDAKFNGISEEALIQSEVLRQIDKSINNSIGTFHEQVLGGIKGFERGNLSGFDIKASDESLFALFGSSELSNNISDAIFEKLAKAANTYKTAIFYYVLIDDDTDTNEKWVIGHEELSISQKRVFKTSLKHFYSLLSGQKDALESLARAIEFINEKQRLIQQPS